MIRKQGNGDDGDHNFDIKAWGKIARMHMLLRPHRYSSSLLFARLCKLARASYKLARASYCSPIPCG